MQEFFGQTILIEGIIIGTLLVLLMMILATGYHSMKTRDMVRRLDGVVLDVLKYLDKNPNEPRL